MAYRLFEGKKHASIYQQYRFTPPAELKNVIIQYLDTKKGQPHELAVDLGCGTGQFTRLLAPHFKEVVGMDVSENQVDEARTVPGDPNVTYRQGTAEDLPFEDGTVDLLTAASAAHWFDKSKFLPEANRVLKPGGCIALLGFSDTNVRFNYKDCGDGITQIYQEVKQVLQPYTSNPVAVSEGKLQDLFSAIPYPEKRRMDNFPVKTLLSVRNLVGFIRTWSMFQTYEEKDPQGAEDLLANIQKRILDVMGVTSPDTEVERDWAYFCVLASKPL
ncbi:putative methyltransferase DDB_G0268948 [Nematolebias whitei]|uniref:putative methyltransferase DDB_G0268948 n=1 Tax=Nematolebias whitei TaxID=451745 RepID=UPI001896C711|nr:putative methyltransferase DDB_G0268948 [Nematolebias whitei]XP_037542251.1 putative methyltransferase DDB_G0268948 [Nematolebias whitei]XP_037542252.1 putative methyltransferase DDB_G0268948 [Nematolebias whitei]